MVSVHGGSFLFWFVFYLSFTSSYQSGLAQLYRHAEPPQLDWSRVLLRGQQHAVRLRGETKEKREKKKMGVSERKTDK